MNHSIRLNELKPGEFGRVTKVGGEGALRQHFLDMGVTPGTVLEMIKLAPMGDPMELRLHGYELTLRLADAEQIEIEAADAPVWKTACGVYKDIEHPGLGEYGKSHERKTEHPLPDSETLTFALAGNQNSGTCACAIPMEEPLGGAEDSADAVGRDTAFIQLSQVGRPELVLHEQRHLRFQGVQETLRMTARSEGQVEHAIGQLVVLPCLVSRRREERDYDLEF